MGPFITLTRRELAGHFLSFRGYVILAGVQFLLGLSLLLIVDVLNNQPFDLPITEKFPSTGLFWLVLLLVTRCSKSAISNPQAPWPELKVALLASGRPGYRYTPRGVSCFNLHSRPSMGRLCRRTGTQPPPSTRPSHTRSSPMPGGTCPHRLLRLAAPLGPIAAVVVANEGGALSDHLRWGCRFG